MPCRGPVDALTLQRLGDLAELRPQPSRWHHWVVEVDDAGRITLPARARAVVDASGAFRAVSERHAVVLRRDGIGKPSRLDARGRLGLPLWLRKFTGEPAVHVASIYPDSRVVVISPVSALDRVLDTFAGEGD